MRRFDVFGEFEENKNEGLSVWDIMNEPENSVNDETIDSDLESLLKDLESEQPKEKDPDMPTMDDLARDLGVDPDDKDDDTVSMDDLVQDLKLEPSGLTMEDLLDLSESDKQENKIDNGMHL